MGLAFFSLFRQFTSPTDPLNLKFSQSFPIIIIIIIILSLTKMLNGLCWDDDYTIAQWLEHRWLQARVPGSSPGGDSQFFLQTFPVCLFPSNQLILLFLILF